MFLSFENVTCRFGARTVLDDLSLSINKGEIVGLLGPNGSGKSSLIRILNGMLNPESGNVKLCDQEVTPGSRRIRRLMGVVFQNPSLDVRLTARENLNLAMRLRNVPKSTWNDIVEYSLRLADISERADEPIAQFSGGMKRRLDLVRALVHNPELLVMDEPTSGLDEASFRRFWDTLLELRRERNMTILVATHRPDEAERCDRLAILHQGKLVVTDTPQNLKRRIPTDVVTVDVDKPTEAMMLISDHLGVTARMSDHGLAIDLPNASETIPRLMTILGSLDIRSVSIRRPSLADVFALITGDSLWNEQELQS